jgi:heptosyltransferase-1
MTDLPAQPEPSEPVPPAQRAGRILVVKLSSMGDLFHALPTVRQIKEATGAQVDWVTQNEYTDLVRCFTDVDRVIGYPRRDWLQGIFPFLVELRKRRYDWVLDLQGLLKSALPARMARARRVLGPSYRREGARLFYSAVTGERNRNRHAVDEALDTARFLGCPEQNSVFPVRFPRVRRTEPGVRVAIAPFSRWPTKNWPLRQFADLARRLGQRIPATFFLVGGPADREAAREWPRLAGGVRTVPCCGDMTLVETGSLMQEMDLAITVDSGPMHMAAALGVPVLALFGPTDPARTGPYGSNHRVLWADGNLSCRPCFSDTCSRDDHACMGRLYPSRVVEVAAEMLKFVPRDRVSL